MSEWYPRADFTLIGWFEDKVCHCPRFKIKDVDWKELAKCKAPPLCLYCGKWGDKVMKCCKCEEYYYQFFSHPRMGYHTRPRMGWYCWNCLEEYLPPVVQEGASVRYKIPPPELVLPPGYKLHTEG